MICYFIYIFNLFYKILSSSFEFLIKIFYDIKKHKKIVIFSQGILVIKRLCIVHICFYNKITYN
jgi:hypothetical protein